MLVFWIGAHLALHTLRIILVNPYFSLIEFATNSAFNTKASIVGFSFDSYLTIQPERTSE